MVHFFDKTAHLVPDLPTLPLNLHHRFHPAAFRLSVSLLFALIYQSLVASKTLSKSAMSEPFSSVMHRRIVAA